ncbi:hypothetical protein FHG87_021761 [Trinorchestia longiramus]|nr:hypothetical protein FHG87_021761 [Trinorchestia longiramus]
MCTVKTLFVKVVYENGVENLKKGEPTSMKKVNKGTSGGGAAYLPTFFIDTIPLPEAAAPPEVVYENGVENLKKGEPTSMNKVKKGTSGGGAAYLPTFFIDVGSSFFKFSTPFSYTTVTHKVVTVEILVPSSTFGCSSSTVKVVFQKVVGHFSNGTAVVFDRYWASDTTQALVVEKLPEPFNTSNIRDCADFIVREGHFAFEFSPGECTAISLSSDLCCEDTSGSHIYVSELFDGGSGEVPPVTDEETGITMQSLPPMLIDIATIPEVSSSTDDDGNSFKDYVITRQFLWKFHDLD